MTLYINCCVRKESRTNRLAKAVLQKLGEDFTELKLYEENLRPLDLEKLNRRTELIERGDFSDKMFDCAKQFANADTIVIAAPYWDLSFPAALKQYFEHINVLGITFRYTPEGTPVGLCRAKRLYYVTTAGGAFVPEEFGFGYVKALAQGFYGIDDVRLLQAVGLDIDGADPEAILARAMDRAAELV